MQCLLEQKIVIKFSVKLGKTVEGTFPMIKTAFGDNCLSKRQLYRWHKAFLEGLNEVSDEACAGWPSTTITNENVLAHTAFIGIHFLVDSKVPRVPQPPHSPDLAPPDFCFHA